MSDLLTALPWCAYPIAAVIGALVFSSIVRRIRGGFSVQTDPQRVFTVAERKVGNDRAGNRCEHKPLILGRCTSPGTQGDHIYPWSAGGATVMENYQSMCQPHNGSKGNHRPTALTIWRLERRRRRYFPDGTETAVSWRFGRT